MTPRFLVWMSGFKKNTEGGIRFGVSESNLGCVGLAPVVCLSEDFMPDCFTFFPYLVVQNDRVASKNYQGED